MNLNALEGLTASQLKVAIQLINSGVDIAVAADLARGLTGLRDVDRAELNAEWRGMMTHKARCGLADFLGYLARVAEPKRA